MPPPSYTKDQLAAASKFLEILENIKRAQKDNVALTQEQTDVLSQNNIAAADVNNHFKILLIWLILTRILPRPKLPIWKSRTNCMVETKLNI